MRGYVGRVVIGCGGEVIARHPRSYEREDTIFEPIHYLPLIEQKIGALDQAAPLAGWELPPAFQTLRRLMEARSPKAGRREYVQVLRLLESFGLEDLDGAVKDALRPGAIGFDAVKHLVGIDSTVCTEAKLGRLRLHDLRHTAASQAAMAGEGLPLVGRLLGHSRHRTTAGYAHLADAHLVEAAEKVGVIIATAMAPR